MQNNISDRAQRPKPPFNHLRSLLESPESRMRVSLFTGIKTSRMEKWFDPDSKVVPMADELVLMALFFGCSTDYLIDLIE